MRAIPTALAAKADPIKVFYRQKMYLPQMLSLSMIMDAMRGKLRSGCVSLFDSTIRNMVNNVLSQRLPGLERRQQWFHQLAKQAVMRYAKAGSFDRKLIRTILSCSNQCVRIEMLRLRETDLNRFQFAETDVEKKLRAPLEVALILTHPKREEFAELWADGMRFGQLLAANKFEADLDGYFHPDKDWVEFLVDMTCSNPTMLDRFARLTSGRVELERIIELLNGWRTGGFTRE